MPGNNQFQSFHGNANGINPADLLHQNGFSQSLQGGGMWNGGGGFDEDELAEGLGMEPQSNGGFGSDQPEQYGPQSMQAIFTDLDINHYSHTPGSEPIPSPFVRQFPPNVQQMRYNGAAAETPSSYNSPMMQSGSHFEQYMENAASKRKIRPVMERTGSQQSSGPMSPHTPTTPLLGASSVPGQPIQRPRHIKALSNQWDGTAASHFDSPLSPHSLDVFKKQGASLPAKTESAFQTQEAKRRRRRESHNLVERRRRDNINERIQELSGLVPTHRLEDEKVKKQLQTNGQLSPSIGQSGSPPRATSMLAGGMGRRASGVPTSIASDDKDKGPNKGDILNGAVGWMKDLMWALHRKSEREKELRELITQLGGTYPFEETEEDRRMENELRRAIAKHEQGADGFAYSRGPGSTLRVPGFTDYAGNPIQDGQSDRMSPANSAGAAQSGGNSSRGTPQTQNQNFWGDNGMTFKEEDEFAGMDMS